jgi:uncharacterized protein
MIDRQAVPPAGEQAPARPGAPSGFRVERVAVAFARMLRGVGLEVPGGAPVHYAEALAAVGLGRREPVYWAGRATLVRRPEDVAAYDAAFGAFWLGEPTAVVPWAEQVTVPIVADDGDDQDDAASGEPDPREASPVVQLRYSRAEVLRHKDFAECTSTELVEAQRLMAAVRLGGVTRRTRRHRPARRGRRPDLRQTVRYALRTGGEPVERRWLAPSDRPRRVVFLCDVSGSMAPYARALLRFLHVAVVGRRRVEAFTIGTRLTRVTRALSLYDPDAALAGATQVVADWSGGTRLGDALREFNDRWGVRGMARGAVVVVLSDGWDRGDPEVLGTEMARLARVAHRVVWVNPLKATPGYAPLVRGMAAALPYVDEFLEGHSLASLESLAQVLTGDGWPSARARMGGDGHPGGAGR